MANIMDQKTRYLISRWGKRISMVEKARKETLNFEKRAALANALENTAQRIRLAEATNPRSIGSYKRYALDIVNATVPNLIAYDCVAVQSMDNRTGMVNYMNYNYSKDKGRTVAGQTFNSSINMGPSDPLYSSNKVEFQSVGRAGNTNYGTVDMPLQLGWHPILMDTFSVQVGDADEPTVMGAVTSTIPNVNGFYEISGTGVSGGVSADGRIYLTFDAATKDEPLVSYIFDNESVTTDGPTAAGFTNVPEIELKIESIPVTAQARTMRSFWAFDAAYELQKEYGQDIETLLATQVTGELAHEIDNELTLDLLAFADAGAPLTWSKAMTPGISLVDHYDSFNATLVEGANQIFNATRKVKANFMVCGLEVASIIEMMRNFTSSGITAVGPHFLGTLGSIKVFVNPDYPSREYVLGYKGANMFEAGYFYCPYMPVASTDLIMDANFRGQRGWATMYGKVALNSKMYIRGAITD